MNNENNILIFVGGASACGKSTLVNALSELFEDSVKYRRVQCFDDIAKEREISKENRFDVISSEEVDDRFVGICQNNRITISDVHYAVQLNRQSDKKGQNIDVFQEYVPTISENLLQKLKMANIKIIAIYITCSPKTCLERAIKRFNSKERELRSISLEDAQLENNAERKEWLKITKNDFVENMELDSEIYTSEELAQKIYDYANKNVLIRKRFML